MCVLALAWCAHPNWRLVVAGNRDEFHARPAEPLRRWDEPDHVLAGRDLLSGGTWLGASEQGRFAVVTNLRGFGPSEPGRPSRGLLLKDLLAGEGRYAEPADADLVDFNPFNLIVVQPGQAEFWSNRPGPTRHILPPQVYGLSNGGLDEPWPKTVRLKAVLRDWIGAGAQHPESLLDGLTEETLTEPSDWPVGPSDVVQEPPLSPIFIRDPVYGTRCSTVVAIDGVGRGIIFERRFGASGDREGETAIPFSWPR
ncbi:NRDE family protein [Sphingobium sp. PNB]|uniref:NRDE family protein n=1 Tax=Sphingobium sp. PNB TaxID=863934 RepID=UPI001CA39538|nr:NRDE family protein [Sphingobium sp. PNB]MCB4858713.1 NRDE family protein [Sphingobium sp. PNB]